MFGNSILFQNTARKSAAVVSDTWRAMVSGTSTAHHNNLLAELDFIINYDIKYRMGDELNAGE